MKLVDDPAHIAPFTLMTPAVRTVPFVYSVPHSGVFYPKRFIAETRLDRRTIRRSEDSYVDALFDVVRHGAVMLRANAPRVYVDLNRAPNELDPDMFSGPLNRRLAKDSPRVAGGLGVIARIVGEGQTIYGKRLAPEEADARIDRFWRPYHRTLSELLAQTAETFGTAVLVDCHSMPSGAVKMVSENPAGRPDLILGDRFGTSCAPDLTDAFAAALADQGLKVCRNRPYAGGYITEHYGRPPSVHALQIEINRALYMDEATHARTKGFSPLGHALSAACALVMGRLGADTLNRRWPLAAE
ncbi:MAG: N-formylglutamate amidohydrolase [Pseudomonadota bacterium]